MTAISNGSSFVPKGLRNSLSSFDDKVYDIVKNVNVDLSEIDDKINELKNEISEVKKELDEIYPIGMKICLKGSCTLSGTWELVGINGTYDYEDNDFIHKMTFTGKFVEDQVTIKHFNYSKDTNDREFGTNNLSWSTVLTSGNYTIDYVKDSARTDILTGFEKPGIKYWISGVMEAEWGLSMINGSQDYIEWFTYAPDMEGNSGYSVTFRLTVKDITKINPECLSVMDYLEYIKN